MRLNDDLDRRTAVHAAGLPWTPSPAKGVERRMIFRIGDEVARATSIVRFAPDSQLPRHIHGGGEEILVLDGVFSDETGDYPAGAYLRNPPGTAHAPASRDGCTLFVRLWQFRGDDQISVARAPAPAGAASTVLFEDAFERVAVNAWPPGAEIVLDNPQGLELLTLAGSFEEGGETFEPLSWLRLPPARPFRARAGGKGVSLWSKTGPLLLPGACAL